MSEYNMKDVIKHMPDYFCRECNTVFNWGDSNEVNEPIQCASAFCGSENVVRVEEYDNPAEVALMYMCQLELKLEKQGSYSHWIPYGTEGCYE